MALPFQCLSAQTDIYLPWVIGHFCSRLQREIKDITIIGAIHLLEGSMIKCYTSERQFDSSANTELQNNCCISESNLYIMWFLLFMQFNFKKSKILHVI